MRCVECGRATTAPAARFCGRCGAHLEPTDSTDRTLPPRRRRSAFGLGLTVAALAVTAIAVMSQRTGSDGEVPDAGYTVAEPAELGLAGPWSTAVSGAASRGPVNPVAGHGRVYTTEGGAMYAVDPTSGELIWRHAARDPIGTRPAVIGSLAVGADAGGLVAVDSSDGWPVWRTATDERITWMHLHASPHLIVAGGLHDRSAGPVGVIAAFDALTGRERWTIELDDWLAEAPSRAGDTVVAATQTGTRAGTILGLDAETGEQRWTVPIAGWADLLVEGDALHAASPHEVVTVDLETGSESWRTALSPGPTGHLGRPRLARTGDELRVVVTDPEPTLVALDPTDGTIRRELTLGELAGRSHPEIVTAGALGSIIAITDEEDGTVRAVDGEGALLWEQRLARPLGFGIGLSERRADPTAGDVWVGASDGTLIALDLSTGEPRWQRRLPPDPGWEPTVTTDGEVVVIGQHDLMTAVSAADGRQRWQTDEQRAPGVHAIGALGTIVVPSTATVARRLLDLDAASGAELAEMRLDPPAAVRSIAADGERTYVGTDAGIYAFDATHRRQRWHRPTRGAIVALTTDSLHVAATDDAGRVRVIDARDGSVRWTRPVDACSPPRLAHGVVIVGSTEGVVAIELESSRERWRVDIDRPHCITPAVSDGEHVHLTDLVRTVSTVSVEDGSVVWRRTFPAGLAIAPSASPAALAVVDTEGTIHLLDPQDGTTTAQLDLEALPLVPPLVHPDGLLVLDDRGDLHAIPLPGH